MGQDQELTIERRQAMKFLVEHYDQAPSAVEYIGEGAWSRCFGFLLGDQELVVRFGQHVDDFQKDQKAYAFATPDLPIPKVHRIGRAFGGYYVISTRVHGIARKRACLQPNGNRLCPRWRQRSKPCGPLICPLRRAMEGGTAMGTQHTLHGQSACCP